MPKYPRLQSLKSINKVMEQYYVKRKLMARLKPVAYVTSGAPVEILETMGVLTLYPENYGALCGARRDAVRLCEVAEGAGYSPDLCSYARSHIGSTLQPQGAPLNGLPKPDLLLCCTNICGTVLKWYEALADHYDVPLFVLDVPFQHGPASQAHALSYVVDQLEELIAWTEEIIGRRWKPRRFRELLALSNETVELWRAIRDMGRHKPSPVNAPDLFMAMAPIVALRGSRQAVEVYRELKAELEARVADGIAAVPGERIRLLWDNIAIWYRLYRFFRPFMDAGVCFVTDGYTNGWAAADPVDLDDPLPSMARTLQSVYINLDLETRAAIVADLAQRFDVQGMVMHANWSCKPFSLTQSDIRAVVRERKALPTLVLEADMCDSRRYNEGAAKERIAAFLEMLG
jgi:benzoyl-CoA reductase/2-hydroxyglutaryl-CoA dehydratase subunit BcrC/BadD/HgdB